MARLDACGYAGIRWFSGEIVSRTQGICTASHPNGFEHVDLRWLVVGSFADSTGRWTVSRWHEYEHVASSGIAVWSVCHSLDNRTAAHHCGSAHAVTTCSSAWSPCHTGDTWTIVDRNVCTSCCPRLLVGLGLSAGDQVCGMSACQMLWKASTQCSVLHWSDLLDCNRY